MEIPENRQCLEKIISRQLGRQVSVRCRQNGDLVQADIAENSREELSDSAVEIFRGRIVEDSG
jgi:hypothetical protein